MRSYLPDYELVTPASLSEALALMDREPGAWKPFAGGTDLMVLLEAGKLPHKMFFSLWHLPELRGIRVASEAVTLGSLTTYTEVLSHPPSVPRFCVATPPVLLVYDAELELVSAAGSRRIPYHEFHTGYKQMRLAPDELIRSIHLPRARPPRAHYYRKVGTRRAQAISKVVFAGTARVEAGVVRDVRVALGSVAPTVLRCFDTEAALLGKKIDAVTIADAQAALAAEIAPIDDIRSTMNYRRHVSLRLLEDFLRSSQGGNGPSA